MGLNIFNDLVLKPKGRGTLTLKEFDAMKDARLSASFTDTETSQKWEMILDHLKTRTDEEGPGPRVKIFDYSPFGKRVLRELHGEKMLEEYGDVYDIGWTIRRDGIVNFDRRVNHHSPIFREFFRGQNPRHLSDRNAKEGIQRMNSLLERTLKCV